MHALTGCEEVFEDKPSIDARDLYLARDEIRKHKNAVREQATRLAAPEAVNDPPRSSADRPVEAAAASTRSTTTDDQNDQDDQDDQPQQLIEPKIKTASALENEADQLDVLLTFLDDLFASTCVPVLLLILDV